MCDNHGEHTTGTSYCTHAPDYKCYTSGWPSCCNEPGGDVMNCPVEKPPCDGDGEEVATGAVKFMKYLRANK